MVTLQSLPGIILLAGAALAAACGGAATPEPGVLPGGRSGAPQETPRFTFRVVASYPHDPGAFTQGLAYHAGRLYESTGLYGRSSLRLVDPATGEVLRIRRLDSRHFGEGIALYEDTIIQLTWTSNLGFVYDRDSFEPRGEFAYGTEGWGIACDGRRLAMSDGSATLYFRDPRTLEETGRIEVRDRGRPVPMLNELEFVRGKIYANVWQTDTIAIVDPATGDVTGWIDLGGLAGLMEPGQPIDVLNGIAYDAENNRLLVTGKLWPRLFEIELVPAG